MRFLLLSCILLTGGVLRAAPWGVACGPGVETELDSRDAIGSATLTDAQLPAAATALVFRASAGGSVPVGLLALTNRTLRISASSPDVTLQTTCETSVFRLSGGDWTFADLNFAGGRLPRKAAYLGGAIDLTGGCSLSVTNCTFTHLGARFAGGAICAWLMAGDVTLSGCTFATNWCGEWNGTGGAVYASSRRGGAARLVLSNCRFAGNTAQNGGAVTTVCTIDDDETPVRLVAEGGAFAENVASYSGGAVAADGTSEFSDTVFLDNAAGLQGGAVNLGNARGRDVACRIGNGSVFRHNRVMNAVDWTCGGAISLWGEGSTLDIEGRHVAFDRNEAASGDAAFGGALFAAAGTVTRVSYAEFTDNLADDAGGAFYVWEGEAAVSTCVFSNDTVSAADGTGGAIAAKAATLAVTNTTIRYANRGALSAARSRTTLTNTLIADNGGEADISAYGEDSQLTMDHVAYGTAEASAAVLETLVTNKCLSGVDKSVYLGDSLLLDVSTYNPVANRGAEQLAVDYRYVLYGWQSEGEDDGWSIGAFQCPAPPDAPGVAIREVKWYHNRADGLYYPQVTVMYLGGDTNLLKSVLLICNGVTNALPESCVAQIRGATHVGQTFVFGVDADHWKASSGSPTDFGYIYGWKNDAEKAALMLFSVTNATRAAVSVVGAANPIAIASVPWETLSPASALAAVSPSRLSMTHSVPAAFSDFGVGTALTGSTEVLSGATVTLFGCEELGSAWQNLGVVSPDREGRFETEIPEKLRFFRLEAEVSR